MNLHFLTFEGVGYAAEPDWLMDGLPAWVNLDLEPKYFPMEYSDIPRQRVFNFRIQIFDVARKREVCVGGVVPQETFTVIVE
ncbi:hypothetical protein AVEN_47650-1 [Araneus ventricosus]|uniref:Uncharacterized protein n=1 Tax=Araneus ventricosus TaxID=182803 RepID=A0A4Y2SWQ4_ARAVE|nr:hypothetical protein AVEN_47650-1 [Araneus ventricosus]